MRLSSENMRFTPAVVTSDRIEVKLYGRDAAVVRAAGARGLTHLAVTDHDTTAGIAEVTALAAARGIRVVPGIEITAVAGTCRDKRSSTSPPPTSAGETAWSSTTSATPSSSAVANSRRNARAYHASVGRVARSAWIVTVIDWMLTLSSSSLRLLEQRDDALDEVAKAGDSLRGHDEVLLKPTRESVYRSTS